MQVLKIEAGPILRNEVIILALDFKKYLVVLRLSVISSDSEFLACMEAVEFFIIAFIIMSIEVNTPDGIFLASPPGRIFIVIEIFEKVVPQSVH